MEFDMVQALMPGFKAALGSPWLWALIVIAAVVGEVKLRITRWIKRW